MAISVRNRPMPSAPVAANWPSSSANPTFSIRETGVPSRVAALRSRSADQPA